MIIHYGGQWGEDNNFEGYGVRGMMISTNHSYDQMVEMMIDELKVDPSTSTFSLQYQIKQEKVRRR